MEELSKISRQYHKNTPHRPAHTGKTCICQKKTNSGAYCWLANGSFTATQSPTPSPTPAHGPATDGPVKALGAVGPGGRAALL